MTGPHAWAKWREVSGDRTAAFLPLHQHSADVAATFESLLALPTVHRRLSRLAGLDRISGEDGRRLTLLVALHDLGKVNRGFRNKAIEGARTAGHIRPVVSLLDGDMHGNLEAVKLPIRERFLDAIRLDDLLAAFADDGMVLEVLLHAVLAHHGRLPEPDRVHPWLWNDGPDDGYEPMAELASLADTALGWFGGDTARPAGHLARPPFLHAFAGLVMLADWLGSDTRWFPFPGEDGAPAADGDRLPFARERAAAMLRARHLDAAVRAEAARRAPATFAALFPGLGDRPRPAQAAMLALDAPPSQGRLTVLEAETGSGKTEAALIHFVDLLRRGEVDGLYFALPTRAAAVQIHGRVRNAVMRILGEDLPVGLAVPGYLRVDEAEAVRLPDSFAVQWPDDPEDAWRDRGWAVEHPKRYLAGPVMVGTLDQLLLGGLQVRHAQLRSGAMLRQLLVIDEVHASDPYMERLLAGVLEQHRRAGGHALLMSATLGAALRTRLLAGRRTDPPPLAEAVALPYPAIHTDGGAAPHLPAEAGPAKAVGIELEEAFEDDAAVAARAVAAARAGARVLVLRNSVARAQSLQAELEAAAEPHLLFRCHRVPAPHHARFAAEDRRLLDAALECAFGRKASEGRGVVAVATQTAEQSLDIDADLMVTDLCPADVLLQRLGRLHRHDRPRPAGFETPAAVVLAPPVARLAGMLLADGGTRGGVMGFGRVYPDLLGLVATRRFLEAHPVLEIPAANRAFVEAATHPEAREALARDLGGFWPKHAADVWGKDAAKAKTAAHVRLDWCEWPRSPWPPTGLPDDIATRLGLDDRRLALPEPATGPFGAPVRVFTLPGWMASDLPADAAITVGEPGPEGLLLAVADRSFRYGRLGIEQA